MQNINIMFEGAQYTFDNAEALRKFIKKFNCEYDHAARAAMLEVAKRCIKSNEEITPSEFAAEAGVSLAKAVATFSLTDGDIHGIYTPILRQRYKTEKTYYTIACDEYGNPLPNRKPQAHHKKCVVYRFKKGR